VSQPPIQRLLAKLISRELEKLDMSPRQMSVRMNYGNRTVPRVLEGENAGSLHLWQSMLDFLELEITIGVRPRMLSREELEVRHAKNSN
jgi:hypothetical protein